MNHLDAPVPLYRRRKPSCSSPLFTSQLPQEPPPTVSQRRCIFVSRAEGEGRRRGGELLHSPDTPSHPLDAPRANSTLAALRMTVFLGVPRTQTRRQRDRNVNTEQGKRLESSPPLRRGMVSLESRATLHGERESGHAAERDEDCSSRKKIVECCSAATDDSGWCRFELAECLFSRELNSDFESFPLHPPIPSRCAR